MRGVGGPSPHANWNGMHRAGDPRQCTTAFATDYVPSHWIGKGENFLPETALATSLLCIGAGKSWYRVGTLTSGVIGLFTGPHQTSSFEVFSSTIRLSRGERPVFAPEYADNAPDEVMAEPLS